MFWEFNSQSLSQDLEEVIGIFLAEVANSEQEIYLFLDEVQFVPNYENILKLYYDRLENLHFVLTGSLSFSYKKKMQESLAGRFIEHHLLPISFEEYLLFTDQNSSLQNFKQAQHETNLNLKQGLAQKLTSEFRSFLLKGRFPDTIFYETPAQVKNYLDSLISQSLNQDSIDYFKITKPREINFLYQYFLKNNGGELSVDKIGQTLGLSWQTTNNYLDILELLGLIYVVYNTDNPLNLARARRKIYTNSAFSLSSEPIIQDSSLGLAVESYLVERFFEQKRVVHYFRERDTEVDLIDYANHLAWEVKFRSKINAKDYANLLKISTKLNLQPNVATFYQTVSGENDLKFIPALLL